jgi:hypothetical protein
MTIEIIWYRTLPEMEGAQLHVRGGYSKRLCWRLLQSLTASTHRFWWITNLRRRRTVRSGILFTHDRRGQDHLNTWTLRLNHRVRRRCIVFVKFFSYVP